MVSDFWDQKNKKHTPDFKPTKRTVSIDGIKSVKKAKPTDIVKAQNAESVPKKKKKRFTFWLSLILVFVFMSGFITSGFAVAEASKDKLNILKMFSNGKYLILFQNNAEMRPTGGFIGSFAVVEISNYKVKNIVYNTNIHKLDDAYIVNHYIAAPAVIGGAWSLCNANYAVSYPETARQVEWFYNQETGDSVDGVIAINASVVKDLLGITGPINMSAYNTIITSDNFFLTLTTEIEKDYFTTSTGRDANEPKTILKDLFPQVLKVALAKNKMDIVKLVYSEIKEKQILFYTNDSNIESSILAENWGGEVQAAKGDYLYVNNSNYGGYKSSLNVKETLNYKAEKGDNGLSGDLTITRSHSGTGVWPDFANINFVRVLVPNGSELVTAKLNDKDYSSQVKTATEAGKTYFSYYLSTAPGTSDVINLVYKLPSSISADNYTLLVQKQPGNLGDDLTAKYMNDFLFDGVLNSDTTLKAS